MTPACMKLTFVFIISLISAHCFSQSVSINSNATAADSSAMLDVSSTTKGLLVPRMTELQKNTISNPATGLLVYQVDGNTGFYFYNGTAWLLLIANPVSDNQKTLIYTTKGF